MIDVRLHFSNTSIAFNQAPLLQRHHFRTVVFTFGLSPLAEASLSSTPGSFLLVAASCNKLAWTLALVAAWHESRGNEDGQQVKSKIRCLRKGGIVHVDWAMLKTKHQGAHPHRRWSVHPRKSGGVGLESRRGVEVTYLEP